MKAVGVGGQRRWDALAVVAAAAVALAFFLSRWQGVAPFAFQSSDAANISAFAAARAYPNLFAGDALLADPSITAFYSNLHTAVLPALGKAAGDDFGLALLWLLIPAVFLHLVGFYVLGRVLFRQPAGAAALTLLAAVTLTLPFGEYWGLYPDAHPRVLFSALLPFVLALLLRWFDRPWLWAAPMALLGLLTYVHPVSAPPVAGAVWLGLAGAALYRDRSAAVLAPLAVAAAAFLVIMAPFAVLYFTAAGESPSPEVARQVQAVLAQRFSAGFGDAGEALALFARRWLGIAGLLPASAVVAAVYLWRRAPERRHLLVFFAVMAVGLLLLSFGVTAIEQALASAAGYRPRLIDFLRCSRYLPMLMIIVATWGLVEWAASRRRGGAILAIVAVVLPLVWAVGVHSIILRTPVRLARCVLQGQVLCGPTPEQADRLQVLTFLRSKTPVGSLVVSFTSGDYGLDVRYAALRPVAFSYKDGGSMGYSSATALLDWSGKWAQFKAMGDETDWAPAAAFAQSVGADYLIMPASEAANAPAASVCVRNSSQVLLKASGACSAS